MTTELSNKERNADKLYEAEYWTDCPNCGGSAVGEAVYATGDTLEYYYEGVLEHSYTPWEGEVIKILYAVCPACDWDQYS